MNIRYSIQIILVLLIGILALTIPVTRATQEVKYTVNLPHIARNDTPIYSRYLTYIDHDNIVVSRADGTWQITLTNESGNYYDPIWSPDAAYILYQRHEPEQEKLGLYLVTPDGKKTRLVAEQDSIAPSYSTYTFGWSPNGKYLIYTPYLTDSTTYYGFNVSTNETFTITTSSKPIQNMESVWSGDGTVFIYRQQVPTSTQSFDIDLYAYDFISGENHRLTEDADPYNGYEFSPARDQIIFNTREGNDQVLWRANPNGTHRMEIDRGNIGSFMWSPNSSWVSYLQYESTPTDTLNTDIFIARSNGLEIRQVTNTPELEQQLVWSPDGEQIAFLRRPYNVYIQDLHVINVQSGMERLLDPYTLANEPIWYDDETLISFEFVYDRLTIVPLYGTEPYSMQLCEEGIYVECYATHLQKYIIPGHILYHVRIKPVSQRDIVNYVTLDITNPQNRYVPISEYTESDYGILSPDLRYLQYEELQDYDNKVMVRDLGRNISYLLSEGGVVGSWAPLGYAPP